MSESSATRFPRRAGWCATLPAAAALALALAPPAVAGGPGKWTAITGKGPNAVEAGVARTLDGRLHVAYHQRTGTRASLRYVRINKRGKKVATSTLESDWTAINRSVDVTFSRSNQILGIYFSGIRSTSPGEPFSGYLLFKQSNDGGKTWTPPAFAAADVDTAYIGAGIGAGADPRPTSGVRVGAWGDSGPGAHGYTFGPAFPPKHLNLIGVTGIGMPEIVIDDQGTVYGGWQQINSGGKGIYARMLTQSGPLDPLMFAPGSSAGGRNRFRYQRERTAIATRKGKSGAWIAYGKGYPKTRKILLWRVGANKARAIVSGKRARGAEHVSIATGQNGRLWIFWERNGRYLVTRTNPAASKVGRIRVVKPPRGWKATHRLFGEGTAKRLDLFAHVGKSAANNRTFHTQVRP